MYYGEIKNCDIANGIGVRVTLFVSGCTNRCEGCFQPETWDFHYGQPFTEETEETVLALLAPDYIDGLTLLGGEPFEPENQHVLLPFLRKVRAAYPEKSIWAFTGFVLEDLERDGSYCHGEETLEMLSLLDVLIDGRFELSRRNITLRFRGSENQRLIDLRHYRATGEIIEWSENGEGKK